MPKASSWRQCSREEHLPWKLSVYSLSWLFCSFFYIVMIWFLVHCVVCTAKYLKLFLRLSSLRRDELAEGTVCDPEFMP